MGTYAPATVTIIGFTLFLLAFAVLVVRVGPGRGHWNQPAARLMRPGTKLVLALWVFAAAHVLLGLLITVRVPNAGAGVLIVATLMGGMYVLMAYGYQVATLVTARRAGHRG